LVAREGEQRTILGTPGFMPSEGIGTARGDIFSLGRLLYMASTGSPPDHHPSLPTSLGKRDDARELMQLMKIINKACAPAANRYEKVELLHADLVNLQALFAEAGA
jgi:serine/threonine protein kinase